MLDRPLCEVFPEPVVVALAERVLESDRFEGLVRASTRAWLEECVRVAREDDAPIGRFVTEEARRELLELVSREGLVDAEWITTAFGQRAMEELVADTLFSALRDFSTAIPRLVQLIVPQSVGRLAKIGERFAGSVGSKVFEDLQAKLETEIRRFVERGTRRALEGAAKFAIDHIDDDVSMEARKNLVAFALSKSGAFHVRPISNARIFEIEQIAAHIAREVATSAESRTIATRSVRQFWERHGDKSLREIAEHFGATVVIPYDELAAVTWPSILAASGDPEVSKWMDGLAAEIAEFLRGDGSSERNRS